MVTEIIIDTREGPFTCLLVDQHRADRFIIAVVWNHLRVFTSKVVIIVRLPINLGARGVSWKIIDAGLLNKGGVGTATIADGPTVIILPDRPGERSEQDLAELHVVNAHPITAIIRIIIDSSKADDVVKTGPYLRVHLCNSKRRGMNRLVELIDSDDDLRLHLHIIEIHFNTVAGIPFIVLKIQSIKADSKLIRWLKR